MRNEQHLKFLHPNDIQLWEKVEQVIWTIADTMLLPLKIAEPKKLPLPDGCDGYCDWYKKKVCIKIRPRDRMSDGGKWWSKPLSYDYIIEVVCHELAHLHFPNHSIAFKEEELRIRRFYMENIYPIMKEKNNER